MYIYVYSINILRCSPYCNRWKLSITQFILGFALLLFYNSVILTITKGCGTYYDMSIPLITYMYMSSVHIKVRLGDLCHFYLLKEIQ